MSNPEAGNAVLPPAASPHGGEAPARRKPTPPPCWHWSAQLRKYFPFPQSADLKIPPAVWQNPQCVPPAQPTVWNWKPHW